jgi:hypothetical protein
MCTLNRYVFAKNQVANTLRWLNAFYSRTNNMRYDPDPCQFSNLDPDPVQHELVRNHVCRYLWFGCPEAGVPLLK